MNGHEQSGFSLIEMLATVAIAALVLAALAGVAGQATRTRESFGASAELEQQAQFAMERMVRAIRGTPRLLVPRLENPGTAHSESVRDVLAMALDPTLDRDGDGFADADNDRDGRIDEDFGDDMTNDGKPGVVGVDDDGDGIVDESDAKDDDEDGASDEDKLDGLDNDGDGLVDEDVTKDMSNDGKPGFAGVNDDGDLFTDEGASQDDDEDGLSDEDWIDVVVYRLSGSTLLERLPNPNPASGNDFTERTIAEGVTLFRAEYLPPAAADRPATVDITLTLGGAGGATASLNTRVRVGGAL